MALPDGINEEEFLEAVNKACDVLAKSFAFGYFDSDDIRQEAFIFAMEAVVRYDKSRPLANFLYTHIKNRLINFKRDRFHRNDPPCQLCSAGERHEDGNHCAKFIAWKKRNSAKQSLMPPVDLGDRDDVDSICEDLTESLNKDEIIAKIDMSLPAEIRSAYLRMKCGESVPKAKREMVLKCIREILS